MTERPYLCPEHLDRTRAARALRLLTGYHQAEPLLAGPRGEQLLRPSRTKPGRFVILGLGFRRAGRLEGPPLDFDDIPSVLRRLDLLARERRRRLQSAADAAVTNLQRLLGREEQRTESVEAEAPPGVPGRPAPAVDEPLLMVAHSICRHAPNRVCGWGPGRPGRRRIAA